MVTRDMIIEALKTVEDPELFLDIWFLGLIYNITIQDPVPEKPGNPIDIEMTFTSPMCPAGPELVGQVKSKIGALEGVSDVNVRITFTPPWEPSDEVKGMLGML